MLNAAPLFSASLKVKKFGTTTTGEEKSLTAKILVILSRRKTKIMVKKNFTFIHTSKT